MKSKVFIRPSIGLLLIAALGLFSACVSGPEIKFEADRTANVGAYKTFALVPFSKSEGITGASPGTSLRYAPVITSTLRNTLTAKGYEETPTTSADFLVNVRASIVPKTDVTEWGMGYTGYGRWGRGGYWAGGPGMGYNVSVDQYNQGVLRIEIYDMKTKDLVWVGWAQDELTQAPEDAAVSKAIVDVLANFPPPPAK